MASILASHGLAPATDLATLTNALAALGWAASVEEVTIAGAGRRRRYRALATRALPREDWLLPRRTTMRAIGSTPEEALAGVLAKAFGHGS